MWCGNSNGVSTSEYHWANYANKPIHFYSPNTSAKVHTKATKETTITSITLITTDTHVLYPHIQYNMCLPSLAILLRCTLSAAVFSPILLSAVTS